ncbi:hypothetical protein CAPTEDRAFT_156991 [Capitella teleta]|uniref:Solute carrier family 12 member 2 n=1 Tax=Capitella teleta TaxID=283909 RepID=R7UCU7_CAPTE|nr:hypothetical protein CAPTEDRAFT_156991 [Capitella teleta]|eukprot:ELU01077.1 hypothetical protein CAPTEDRAFT_156991 [Capitella teleta]
MATHLKTFGRNTLETLPHADHYRNLLSATGAMRKRPTLLELHENEEEVAEHLLPEAENGQVSVPVPVVEEVKPPQVASKFGWIKGVLVRCLLNIYGVMLFLRLSWVVGQSGIGLTAVVILLATVVTTITALSMSAICTNGQVKGGGAYFMISRSLGPEFGGAIGLIFSMANAVAVAMYIVGFAETIRDILKDFDCLMVDETNDVRIIGLITIVFLLSIALIGMEWEARAQVGLLGILIVAIINFMIGSLIPPNEVNQQKGFVGYKSEVFIDNFGPDYRDGYNFFSVFAIFFPAATGILAGANISGDLADAGKAIPKGTFAAILISSLTYIVMAWMAGSCVLRDAYGPVSLVASGLANDSGIIENITYLSVNATCEPGNCLYGLQNDMQAMQLISGYGPITVAGIISATLSSALASLVSAPKVFQAVCKDRIFPGIHVFSKGYGNNDEPRRAYLLAFVIGVACICIGDLNAIAPLISNFFLMSYALINYSCFDASLANAPGWRPAFKYYSMWLSLFGAIICLSVMFVINWWSALITLGAVSALYIYVHYRKPDINWGSSTQAHVYRNALQHTLKLVSVLEHVKNFRPQVMVLTGFPSDRPALVDFASCITRNISLMLCGHVIVGENDEKLKDLRMLAKSAYNWLHKTKVKSFYNVMTARSLRRGAQCMMQCAGAGKLRPNTFLVGFKNDWQGAPPQEVHDFFMMIHDAFDLRFGIGVLRLKGGLDYSHLNQHLNAKTTHPEVTPLIDDASPMQLPADQQAAATKDGNLLHPTGNNDEARFKATPSREESESESEEKDEDINAAILKDVRRFRRKQKGFIDVWWLFDDGGLTLLLPYLLTTKSQWSSCKLRVFMAGSKKMQLDQEQRHMATLLSRFRIEYSSMTVVHDIGKKPSATSQQDFDNLISDWMLDEDNGESAEEHPWKISQDELTAQTDKTNRHIRLKELLTQYSSDSSLIVMTLPMPRKGMCSSGLYMAWIDTLTQINVPILLLRGNQESVLTYYS